MKAYYESRAPEYDDWYLGTGLFAERDRPGVVVDSALREDVGSEELQGRFLRDGSRWLVFKRHITPASLVEELGGGHALFAGRWFVAVRSP